MANGKNNSKNGKNGKPVRHKLTFSQKLADDIATIGGSWYFIITFFLFLIVWMIINTYLAMNFDPFRNRLHLRGGGSWFQEGVAEYISTPPNELSYLKGLVKRGKHVPMEDFVVIRSLLMSADQSRVTGGSQASDNYAQAASVIEFVRHSKWSQGKFDEFLHTIGSARRGDRELIDVALKSVFAGEGLERFEQEYVKYWTKRKKPRKL